MEGSFYSKDGVPISLEEWSRLRRHAPYWRVSLTHVMDAAEPGKVYEVSTIWLGINYAHRNELPVIFESMVFAEGSGAEELSARYSTLAEARQGHMMLVVEVSAEMKDPVVMDVENRE